MEQEYWNHIQTLFNAAIALPIEQRHQYLDVQCDGNDALLSDVLALLEADKEATAAWNNIDLPTIEKTQPALLHGERIGPYQILEKIGEGGMGMVFRALDTRLERELAIKCLSPKLNPDPQARARFFTEARAVSRLDHPNICAIYDIGETDDGKLYIVMPYYRGEDLRGKLRRTGLSVTEALDISQKICEGLTAAHEKNIYHRDIKPANILVDTDSQVKILDFGVAKIAGVENTGTGISLGTVAYMAPEQIQGGKIDGRADIWSLGVILYEAISGQRLFKGTLPHEVMYAVLNEDIKPVSGHLNRQIPALDHVVGRMLRRNPDQRWESSRELSGEIQTLRQKLENEGDEPRTIAAPSPFSWDPASLDGISKELLKRLGPIAPVLVKKYAKQTQSLDTLCEKLASHLPDNERLHFLNEVSAGHSQPSLRSMRHHCPKWDADSVVDFDDNCIAKLEKILLPLIGPIAGSVINRAKSKHTKMEPLCDEIASLIVDDSDKHAFLDQVRNLCSPKNR